MGYFMHTFQDSGHTPSVSYDRCSKRHALTGLSHAEISVAFPYTPKENNGTLEMLFLLPLKPVSARLPKSPPSDAHMCRKSQGIYSRTSSHF